MTGRKWSGEVFGPSIPAPEVRRLIRVREALAHELGRLPTAPELADVAATTVEIATASLSWNTETRVMPFEGFPLGE